MKRMMKQTPGRRKLSDRTVSDDLDAVGDAAEDAVGVQTAVAMLLLLLRSHPRRRLNSLERLTKPGLAPESL